MPLSNQQTAERPAHVHVKKAKGRSYLYYWTGQGHIRLPDMDDPAFSDALEEAQLVRWRASKLTLPPMSLLLEGPTGDDLYFIRAADAVKIGRTVDVWNRLKKMQADNAAELECVCRLPNKGREEKDWHERFAHLRIRGEWFRWVPEIAKAIAETRTAMNVEFPPMFAGVL
jgi:hypothetical protein